MANDQQTNLQSNKRDPIIQDGKKVETNKNPIDSIIKTHYD